MIEMRQMIDRNNRKDNERMEENEQRIRKRLQSSMSAHRKVCPNLSKLVGYMNMLNIHELQDNFWVKSVDCENCKTANRHERTRKRKREKNTQSHFSRYLVLLFVCALKQNKL